MKSTPMISRLRLLRHFSLLIFLLLLLVAANRFVPVAAAFDDTFLDARVAKEETGNGHWHEEEHREHGDHKKQPIKFPCKIHNLITLVRVKGLAANAFVLMKDDLKNVII